MKAFTNVFARLINRDDNAQTRSIYREWDRQRRNALGPSDLAEIDAIFSRHL